MDVSTQQLIGGFMIHFKDHKTLNIFDPFAFLGPKCQRACNNVPEMGMKSVPPRLVDMW